jgi:hypothetical protein
MDFLINSPTVLANNMMVAKANTSTFTHAATSVEVVASGVTNFVSNVAATGTVHVAAANAIDRPYRFAAVSSLRPLSGIVYPRNL